MDVHVQALTAASKLERKLGQRLKGRQDEQQLTAGMKRNHDASTGARSSWLFKAIARKVSVDGVRRVRISRCSANALHAHGTDIHLPILAGKRADAEEASDREEEDEEEGRAGAIQKQKRPLQQDLMLYHSTGKKRKKKKA